MTTATPCWLLRREPLLPPPVRRLVDRLSADHDRLKIRCPKCSWQPARDDRWGCQCGHVWNTFETHGVCPGCGREWRETQCLRCTRWSPHDDWYVEGGGGEQQH